MTDTEIEAGRQANGRTDRDRETERDRVKQTETDRQRDRDRETVRHRQTYGRTDGRRKHRQTDRDRMLLSPTNPPHHWSWFGRFPTEMREDWVALGGLV